MNYRRAHILPGSNSIGEAASFLISSLLISHGARVDSIAAVEIEGFWIIAYGDRIRHLRPDQDSAEGWVRAVLYKGRHRQLGASVLDRPPRTGNSVYCIKDEPGAKGLNWFKDTFPTSGLHDLLTFIYLGGRETTFPFQCEENIAIEINIPRHLKPALINIILDRIEAGLTPV